MGQTAHRHGRQGRPGTRPHGEIGYHAIRVGDNPGEHTMIFGMLGETIELTVRATNRDCYAAGALAAAKFLAGKPARTVRHERRAGAMNWGLAIKERQKKKKKKERVFTIPSPMTTE